MDRRSFLSLLAASGLFVGCGTAPTMQPTAVSISQPVATPGQDTASTLIATPVGTETTPDLAAQPGINRGDKAANIEMTHFESSKLVSLHDYLGKAIYLNFWATWCPPCREEMPAIEKLFQKYKDKNIAILGVSSGETRDVVEEFLKKYNYSFTIMLDERKQAARRYNIASLPTSIFIRTDGTIVQYYPGAIPIPLMERGLERALESPS